MAFNLSPFFVLSTDYKKDFFAFLHLELNRHITPI